MKVVIKNYINIKQKNMKTEKEIKRLSKKYFDSKFYDEDDYDQDSYFEGYKKCQKDMTRLLKQCIIHAFRRGQLNNKMIKEGECSENHFKKYIKHMMLSLKKK